MPLTRQDIEAIKAAILPELKAELREAVADQAQRRWIKGILAASKASGIHKDELRRLLTEKQIRGYQRTDNTWVVDRLSLDAYHDRQIDDRFATDTHVRNKVVDFLNRSR